MVYHQYKKIFIDYEGTESENDAQGNSLWLTFYVIQFSGSALIENKQLRLRRRVGACPPSAPAMSTVPALHIFVSIVRVDEFFENVRLTSTLKISLKVLNSDAVMERLNESSIDIHTVEIESTCKLHQVLTRYSLPSCLRVLRINNNNLNILDICELPKFSHSMNSLHTLDLCRTKFKDSSFYALISVLNSCKGLISLSLIDNGLTKAEITGLITTFESTRNLNKLNLSKSNITEAQANNILHKLEQAKNIASLDLSHNALKGNKIVLGICQLQSLEEVDLSHNYIRFSPLPDFEGKHDSLSINTKNISLSSNHMTPVDISQFCSLIGSDLLKLNLDCNHVGNSVLSLCSIRLRIKHLKVLSLANTDISDAVDGLAALLSLVRELEELNLSSNNLTLTHFQQVQLPLSNLFQLKKLNLSNNPDGISALLESILPSFKNLEELRLSNAHLNGDDLKRTCHPLASFKHLKYLEISMNAIGPDGIKELANILQGFPLLERLDLSRSCLQDDDINVLCQGLVPFKRLKYLNFSGSMIDSQILGDAWFLPPTLEELILGDVIHGEKLFAKLKPLQHLRILHLTNLKLRTCDVEMLATTLSSFSTLEELSVDNIVISDSNCYKIFSAMKWLGYLRKIHLTNLKLRACDVEMLATTLSSFPTLEELSLANIVVENSNLDKLFSAIKSLKNIKKIDLSGIKLCDESGLADMLSSLLFLEELVLSGMSVVNMDDVRFFSALKLLKRLRKLDLGNINVREEKAFFNMLSSLSMLEEIVFPAVVLKNSDGTVGYFSALESLIYLKNLDLRWSKICKPVQEAVTRGLLSLQLLQRLVLGVIDCDDAKQLFAALGNLKYLKELDLGKICISKTVAGSLACVLPSLTLLEKLVLKGIDYDEQICAALVNLKYLKELDLHKTHITKTGLEALGRVLPSLTLLEKLVLAIDCRDKCDVKLFAALGNLKNLKELHLGESYISETAAEALVRVLPSLTLLEKLVLGGIVSDYECDEQLFAPLRNLKYLKELDLGEIYPTKTGAEALARVLQSLTLLEEVRIVHDDERDEQLFAELGNYEQLFAALGNLKYLKKLSLCNLFLVKTGAEALAHVLPSLTLLEKLVLKGIDHYDECGEQLFASLGNLKYLKELRLHDMHLTKTGAEALARVLPSLTLLKKLALEWIDHYEECDEQLFAALGNLKYLKKLDLCKIYLTKTGAEALARVLRSLTLLEKLELEKIDRDDECDEQLFGSLGNLKYLKKLFLRHLYLTKTGAEALGRVLPSLDFLKELVLCGISFENTSDDKLFTAVGSLSSLNRLCLPALTITQAGATALTTALTRLRYLKFFSASLISIENDEDETMKEILKAAERKFECSCKLCLTW